MRHVPSIGVLLLLCLLIVPIAPADVVTGSVTMWYEGHGWTVAGDGTNHVNFSWSRQYWTNGFFYGSLRWTESDVAFAGYNIDLNIFDASALSYTNDYINIFGPDGGVDATGCFIAARNINTGQYGLLRIDQFHVIYPNPFDPNDQWPTSAMDATWWFQTDGTGRFSTPEPTTMILLGAGMVPFALRLRKR